MLTAVGQYFGEVPWPYFSAALGAAIGFAFWTMNQSLTWHERTSLDDKLTLGMRDILQYVDDGGQCGYRLCYEFSSSYGGPLFVRLLESTWEIENKADTATIIDPVESFVHPRIPSTIMSSSIAGLGAGVPHPGKFRVRVGFGKQFGKITHQMHARGSFKVLASTSVPSNEQLPCGFKLAEFSIERMKDE